MTQSFYGTAPEPRRSDDLLAEYGQFLAGRNGPSFRTRDERMTTFDPTLVRAKLRVDSASFNRNYGKLTDRDLSNEELALLAFVKMNAGEAYGVEVISKARKPAHEKPTLAASIERTLVDEERYHTRLLVGAAGHFEGLTVGSAWRPPMPLRALIATLARMPPALFHPLLLAAEIAGVHTFNWMLERLKSLFRDEPEVRESMERRLIEVLIDEVGHITFNRVLVGSVGRSVALPLARLIAESHRVQDRELIALGLEANEADSIARFDYSDLPDEVRRRAFFA